ncbi:Uncharacterised protein [uncultured archaeon]|nr:Uncharacterised protein [uncultured archaeon]
MHFAMVLFLREWLLHLPSLINKLMMNKLTLQLSTLKMDNKEKVYFCRNKHKNEKGRKKGKRINVYIPKDFPKRYKVRLAMLMMV